MKLFLPAQRIFAICAYTLAGQFFSWPAPI